MATIHDVARLAGVSTATVSRTFANPQALSDETRRRVLDVAGRLNYRPRGSSPAGATQTLGAAGFANSRLRIAPGATRRAQSQSASIGFQFFSSGECDRLATNVFYSHVLAGAQAEADALGMHLLLHTTHRHNLTKEVPAMIREQAVSGMLLVGTADEDILKTFGRYVPHIVLIDNQDRTGQHDSVFTDGFGGAYQAATRLLELGHTRIGFLTSAEPNPNFVDRLNGYVCAHFHAGVALDREWVIATGYDEAAWNAPNYSPDEQFIRDIAPYLRRSDRPTAFVAINDQHAVALMKASRQCGLALPEEMSIIGFDDVALASEMQPTLSSFRVNKEMMGCLAVRRLHKRLSEAQIETPLEAEPPVFVRMPVTYVERESCAARPHGG